ncbi:MAG: hypothetical protein KAI28_02810, partial [Sphingomonadales bacterium]|nr:hypothetical protein [Sphingomonadales bacterium]
ISSGARRVGKLAVSQFDNMAALKKTGHGLYSTDEAPAPAEKFKVVQRMLENSNVNAIEEMTNLITVQRSYERTSKMISSVQEMRGSAIKRLGTIK